MNREYAKRSLGAPEIAHIFQLFMALPEWKGVQPIEQIEACMKLTEITVSQRDTVYSQPWINLRNEGKVVRTDGHE